MNERGGGATQGLQLHTIHFLDYLRKQAALHYGFHGPFVCPFLHIKVLKIILYNFFEYNKLY